jgi:acetyl-CoA C-acetyltransferase
MSHPLRSAAAIVGAAESDLGKLPHTTALELQAQAALRAVQDAGLRIGDIDAVFAHMEDRFASLQLVEHLGIRPRYVDSSNVGGMSNLMHLRHALAAIHAGFCDIALITYGSTQLSDGARRVGALVEDPRTPRGQYVVPHGQLSPIGYYAMVAQLHRHRYGSTDHDLAAVAFAARQWANLNPKAYRRGPTSIEEILASPMVATPLRQRDCCVVTDGGGALVVTRADRARDLPKPSVYIKGCAERFVHHYTPLDTADWLETGVAHTTAEALHMADVTLGDMDALQIYDHFTIGVLQALEEIGVCARGEAGGFVREGHTLPGGRLPMNTSGGGLSYAHPGMFGIFLAIEAVRQLRGEAGERQVPNARHMLCQAPGLVFASNTTIVLGLDP